MDIWDLGEAIKKARKEQGMSQQMLSARSGVARSHIAALENQRLPDIGFVTLSKLVESLKLDLRLGTANSGRPTLDDLQAENEREVDDAPRMGRR